MKSDALVVGAELEGLVAALRLSEAGLKVRLVAAGAGSLHYASGAVRVLGYAPGSDDPILGDPLDAIGLLNADHPYRRLGPVRIARSLDWFLATMSAHDGPGYRQNGGNGLAVTPAGLEMPIRAAPEGQALFDDIAGKSLALVGFEGHLDLPLGLLRQALAGRGIESAIHRIEAPGGRRDSLGIARAFDGLDEPEVCFSGLAPHLPKACEAVLFPAVLGLVRHRAVLKAAEDTLGRRCFEVPTLPPSVAGLRLHKRLVDLLRQRDVVYHPGTRLGRPESQGRRLGALFDRRRRRYEAGAFIAAGGGVLMGGLDALSCGTLQEPVFGLAVHQTRPLSQPSPDRALDALQETGVEADRRLRPLLEGAPQFENLFATGALLAHWHPTREASAEGVALATGLAAAEEALAVLEA